MLSLTGVATAAGADLWGRVGKPESKAAAGRICDGRGCEDRDGDREAMKRLEATIVAA